MFQQEAVQEAVAAILGAIGDDPTRPGLRDTPNRVARMYQELFWGIGQDPKAALTAVFEEAYSGPVILRDIPFYSICEHHLLPFFGTVHIGYIPKGLIVGASKLARALEIVARRPQLQERLTQQLADALFDGLEPQAIAVVVSAEHLCMSMRGVQKPGTVILTISTRGSFPEDSMSREQLLAMVRGS